MQVKIMIQPQGGNKNTQAAKTVKVLQRLNVSYQIRKNRNLEKVKKQSKAHTHRTPTKVRKSRTPTIV